MEKNYYVLSQVASKFIEKNSIKVDYTLFLPYCPVCSSKNHKRIFNLYGYHYYKCKSCSFVFVNPRLNDLGSYEWYNSNYYAFALGYEININSVNENYFSTSLRKEHFKKTIEIILKKFPDKNTKILDIGCSTGSILAYLRDKHGYSNVSGIDLSE